MTSPWLLTLDAGGVLAFVALGRGAHTEGVSVPGIGETAAPFLAALGAGLLVTRAWRDPVSWRTGLGVWAVTVAGGMVLRRAVFADGTAASFVVVTSVVLGSALLGWRAAARRIAARSAAGA